MRISKKDTFAGEPINNRRFNLGIAITAQVTIAQIVNEDDDYIWANYGFWVFISED
jgi:hypothetical protein